VERNEHPEASLRPCAHGVLVGNKRDNVNTLGQGEGRDWGRCSQGGRGRSSRS